MNRDSLVLADSAPLDVLVEAERRLLERMTFNGIPVGQPATLSYNPDRVFEYAQRHCAGGNDCPDGEYANDCTHFVCHCLAAARVFVTPPMAQCRSGACIRVNELAAAFANAVGTVTNVTRITSHGATRRGDFCFIPSWFGLSKEHVMLLAEQATPTGARVYAHTQNRCGVLVQFEGASCIYYRIDPA